jgi:hypothetical protein
MLPHRIGFVEGNARRRQLAAEGILSGGARSIAPLAILSNRPRRRAR